MKLLIPDPGLLIWTLLAFLVVFFILKTMAWPAIIKGLKEREQNIEEAIATAEKVKWQHFRVKTSN
jgi:F-type H+-transporting ATPase subunit b